MRAIFLARGPAFKENTKIASFQNINLYPLMCKLLGIKGQNSNSTVDMSESVLRKENTNSFLNYIFSLLNLFFGKN